MNPYCAFQVNSPWNTSRKARALSKAFGFTRPGGKYGPPAKAGKRHNGGR